MGVSGVLRLFGEIGGYGRVSVRRFVKSQWADD